MKEESERSRRSGEIAEKGVERSAPSGLSQFVLSCIKHPCVKIRVLADWVTNCVAALYTCAHTLICGGVQYVILVEFS